MNIIESRTLAQRAFEKGYIVVFDMKDGFGVAADDQFVRTGQALSFCREALFDHYADMPDEEDPQCRSLRQTESDDELLQGFHEVSSEYMFFVLDKRFDQASLDVVLSACRERSFFPPWYVIKQGEIVYGVD